MLSSVVWFKDAAEAFANNIVRHGDKRTSEKSVNAYQTT